MPPPTQADAALALLDRFEPLGWQLFHPFVGWWEAFKQEGTASRTVVAATVIALYAKLAHVEAAAAEQAAPSDPAARYLAYLERLGCKGTESESAADADQCQG